MNGNLTRLSKRAKAKAAVLVCPQCQKEGRKIERHHSPSSATEWQYLSCDYQGKQNSATVQRAGCGRIDLTNLGMTLCC